MNSYWVDSSNKTNFEKLDQDVHTEVCIIGAGITGISIAYQLTKQGKKVVLIDKGHVAMGVTANTTAKITSQHGLFYHYLAMSFGRDTAKAYLDSNQDAIQTISHIVSEEKIDCDFEFQDSYVYSNIKTEAAKIADEVNTVKDLGFNAEFVKQTPLPVPIVAAIRFPNQAQFHPRKYLLNLVSLIQNRGGQIYENSKVIDCKKENNHFITYTENNKIYSDYVVLATHYPILNFPGFYFLKMYQEKSYLIGVETKKPLFDGMYITSESPTLSFRTTNLANNKRLLLIGGSEHKTGATDVPMENRYQLLEETAKELYPDAKIKYRWSTEDCITLDKIPYIGNFSSAIPNLYVATGFKKWGMTTSQVAATILSEAILGKENSYACIYNATRFNPIKTSKEFGNMLKQTTYSLFLNKYSAPSELYENIANDHGGVVDYQGNKIGVYKDTTGNVYAVRPYCTHLGCELSWNNLDKTWDCPCHGSRFDFKGNLITEPSKENLETIDIENLKSKG